MPTHPCLTCGACCASYRVAFHWSEADARTGGATPEALTARLDPHRVAMQGTLHEPVRCVALRGVVGQAVRCAIYPQRPSPCRAVIASWEHGGPSAQCDKARARHGLRALTPADWRKLGALAPD